MSEKERKLMQDLIDNVYGQFVRDIALARGMEEDIVRSWQTGGSIPVSRLLKSASLTAWETSPMLLPLLLKWVDLISKTPISSTQRLIENFPCSIC